MDPKKWIKTTQKKVLEWLKTSQEKILKWLKKLTHRAQDTQLLTKKTAESDEFLSSDQKPPIQSFNIVGLSIIVVFVGGFLLWASLATLESAAVAPGKIIAESKNKTIEHLEGGIVSVIYVKDGQKVTKGQILIKLDVTRAYSTHEVLKKQYLSLLAEEARLVSELDDKTVIDWPKELDDEKRLKSSQERILKNNYKAMNGQLKILNKQIKQLDNEIKSYNSQVTSEAEQLKLIEQEVKIVAFLEKKGLIELPRLLELKREAAKLQGNHGQYLGLIAKAEQKIGETQQRIITIKDTHLKEILTELKELRDKLTELKPKLDAAIDTLTRTAIVAPIDGVVVGLTQFTQGGVITPGEALMNIFPVKDKLIAEANVNPSDIELIRIGQKARVTLTALKQRNTPSLIGTVIHISADVFVDERANQTYYKAKIEIPESELKKLNNISLYPGMQVMVMIVTDKRTPMDYFITPITDSFRYAFRER